jgi:hypothetical protein
MTEHRSFKRLVRARMEKTGESYTAARATILAGPAEGAKAAATSEAVMPVSEDSVRERTGHGWEWWLDALDEWGGVEHDHTEIARHLREELRVPGWWSQAITVGYERARGMRAVGETKDGFVAGASRTVAVGVERLYDHFADEESRSSWLPEGGRLSVRTATRPKSARFDWDGGPSRVVVGFESKGDRKSTVFVSHERLADAGEADRMKATWRAALSDLKRILEG